MKTRKILRITVTGRTASNMNFFSDLMITALYTAFFQNLVLSFAYGSSEAVRISLKPRAFGMFTAMISGFAVISGAICQPIDSLPAVSALPESVHALVYAAVLAGVYLITAVILKNNIQSVGSLSDKPRHSGAQHSCACHPVHKPQKRLFLRGEHRLGARRGRCLCCCRRPARVGSSQALRKQRNSSGVQRNTGNVFVYQPFVARLRGFFGQFHFLLSGG